MALGRKTGGRVKGVSRNKATQDARLIFKAILEKKAPEVEAWLVECAQGIEIEKTLPDGTTVVGRLNADPGKAIDLMLKMSEFYFPKLARSETTMKDATDEQLLAEMRRRRESHPLPPEPPAEGEPLQ